MVRFFEEGTNMKLRTFYPLISRNARCTLVSAESRKVIFSGMVREIPDSCDDLHVVDFLMNNEGRLTFNIEEA